MLLLLSFVVTGLMIRRSRNKDEFAIVNDGRVMRLMMMISGSSWYCCYLLSLMSLGSLSNCGPSLLTIEQTIPVPPPTTGVLE